MPATKKKSRKPPAHRPYARDVRGRFAAKAAKKPRKPAVKKRAARRKPKAKPPKKPIRETQKTLNGEWGVPEAQPEAANADERTRDRERKRQQRGAERDITIPDVVDPERRKRCEANTPLWLTTYFHRIFYLPITDEETDEIALIEDTIRYGGSQSQALARGGGKTKRSVYTSLKCLVVGMSRFILLIPINGTKAKTNHASFMYTIERMKPKDPFYQDYPEVVVPIVALKGGAQRSKKQTVNGERTFLHWGADFVMFPDVPGSKAAGAILASIGIDSGDLRGETFGELRPDVVIMDDIEDIHTANSLAKTELRLAVLKDVIPGLGGQDKALALIMNGTIVKKNSIVDCYTNRKLHPEWHGIRRRLLQNLPHDTEKWDKYIELHQKDHYAGDKTGRTAARFYRKHRKAMDAGAVISNPLRFKKIKCKDGTRLEISALQGCYNVISDRGWEHFNTEYQGDPPDPDPDALRIEMRDIQRKLNGLPRAAVPEWADAVATGIDVHGYDIHYATVAAAKGFGCAVVDYDVEDVHSPRLDLTAAHNVKAVDEAILTALLNWREAEREGRLAMADTGEVRHSDRVIIDAGWKPHPVYEFVKANPGGAYRASNGCGSNEAQKFRMPTKRSKERKIGFHYFASFRPEHSAWLFLLAVDYWKRFVHDAFATAPDWTDGGPPGEKPTRGNTITLFGDDPHAHRAFASEIVAERWELDKWVGPTGKKPGRNNHFLDCVAYALAGLAMQGIRPIGTAAPDAPAAKDGAPAAAAAGGYKPREPGAPGTGYKIGR